ncbi:MAG: ribonuclease H-like domain-containing protein [Eubacterium sp.]|nr:ribonuclease H-like domain-containing protein [Eubacterium sp.]
MERIVETIPYDRVKDYDLASSFFGDKKICMFDIETTGLSPLKSFTYLIGINVFKDGEWQIIQLFNDDGSSEPEMIRTLHSVLEDMDVLIHFNGDTFDIPYIEKRTEMIERTYHISMVNHFRDTKSFDLLKDIRPYKFSLGLPNLKQKTIERYIGLDRVDMYNGGQLIDVYLGYLAAKDEKSRKLVLRHNRDDMEGMIFISSMLAMDKLCRGDLEITNIGTKAVPSGDRLELVITARPEKAPVKPICTSMNRVYLDSDENEIVLRAPILSGSMNYYYGNTVKDGVDCVNGFFIPGPACGMDKVPLYREKPKSKETYVMINDAFLGEKIYIKEYMTKMIKDIMHNKRKY